MEPNCKQQLKLNEDQAKDLFQQGQEISTDKVLLCARYTDKIELYCLNRSEKTVKLEHIIDTPGNQYLTCPRKTDSFVCGTTSGIFALTPSDKQIHLVSEDPVLYLCFSPLNKYLCVFRQYSVNNPINLRVFNVNTSGEVFSLTQRNMLNWAPKWTEDESFAGMYHEGSLMFILNQTPIAKTRFCLKNMKLFALSPPDGKHVAVFCLGSGSEFSRFGIYETFDSSQQVNSMNMCNIDDAEIKWHPKGYAILAMAQNTCTTQSSYYGESKLILLDVRGDTKTTISFGSEETKSISDFVWSPVQDEFCVIFEKSRTALYNIRGERLRSLAHNRGARNGILYAPHGQFLALTGSGNVKGNFEIWHRPHDTEKSCKNICPQVEVAYATMFQWTPDGSMLLVATTFPRLREGNVFHMYDLAGNCFFKMPVPTNNLCDLVWQQNCAISDNTTIDKLVAALPTIEQRKNAMTEQDVLPTKYVPPHLRGITSSPIATFLPLGLSPSDSPRRKKGSKR